MANFYNNVESIWEGLIKKNHCYKIDSNVEFIVEAGGAEKVESKKMNISVTGCLAILIMHSFCQFLGFKECS